MAVAGDHPCAPEKSAVDEFSAEAKSQTTVARCYRLHAERLLAEGKSGEAADALRAGLLAVEKLNR